jgi:lambda family phage tail tape measure protein
MIARLGVLLGLNTAEFNKGLADSGKKMEEFVGKAKNMATVAAGAFAAMTVKAMLFADEVADIAKANDIAIDTVIKLQNALANSGGKAEDAGKMFASFTNYVDKAAEGSFEAQKNFAKIGISLKDLETLTSQQLFLKTIQGLSEIEDPLTRSAKAMELLGKAAKGVDFTGVAEGMKGANSITERQANAIKLLADFYDRLGQASRDLTLNFVDFLEPALRKINERLEDISKHAKSGTLIQGFFATLADDFKTARIQATLEEIERLNAKIADPNVGQFWKSGYRKELADAIKLLDELRGPQKQATQVDVRRTEPVEYMKTPEGKTGDKLRDVKLGVDPEEEKRKREAEKEQKRLSEMYARAHRARMEEISDVDESIKAYGQYVEAIKEYDAAQARALTTEEQLTNLELQRRNLREHNYEFLRASIKLTAELAEEQLKLNEATLTPKDREEAQKRLNDLYQRRFQLLGLIREEAEKADKDLGVFEGVKKAGEDFFKNFPKDMETGAMMFGSVINNMSAALDNFVRTGKLNFKEFARSIILDLIAIQLKASAMKLLANIFGFSLPTRAMGGTVTGNSAYLVGERGPELFVPRMSGTIIPNHNLQSAGTSTNITNYNIQAIDVKSFEQRLMGSSRAIWAANQYAQKGLAVTPGRM